MQLNRVLQKNHALKCDVWDLSDVVIGVGQSLDGKQARPATTSRCVSLAKEHTFAAP